METEGEMLELTTSRDIKPILTPFNMFILITPILMIMVDVFPSYLVGGHCWSVGRLIVRSLKLITDLVINVYIIYVWAVNCKLAHQVCACKVY